LTLTLNVHLPSPAVALVLDTTASVQPALPALRGAALNLIDNLRPGDSAAVFRFR